MRTHRQPTLQWNWTAHSPRRSGALTSSVILFPQSTTSIELSVNYNSQPYTATLTIPDGALKAGNNYTYTVTVRNKDLTVSSATISDWNPVNGGNVNADL